MSDLLLIKGIRIAKEHHFAIHVFELAIISQESREHDLLAQAFPSQ